LFLPQSCGTFSIGKVNENCGPFLRKAAVLLGNNTMDFGFSGEIFFIMLLALILFGPKKLPELARTWGKFMAEFKKASNEFQGQIHEEIRKLELEEVDPRKHLEPEIAKISSDEDLSIQGALNRLTERMKNTVAQDTDV
jgi:Tat protein translocase TatB subunit